MNGRQRNIEHIFAQKTIHKKIGKDDSSPSSRSHSPSE